MRRKDYANQRQMLCRMAMASDIQSIFIDKETRHEYTVEETRNAIRTEFNRLVNLTSEAEAKKFFANIASLPF